MVRTAHGLDLSPYDEKFLAKSLDKRLEATVTVTPAAYTQRLANDLLEATALHHSLHIVYSEFFRSPLAFALLEQMILPRLLDSQRQSARGEVRVWSAGCATGQEAWSVAMLLDELSKGEECPLSYRIFATDLSPSDLALARTGVYSAEAVGNIRSRHLRLYLSRHGESYAIAPRLRERVDFSIYDLLDESTSSPPASIFGDFDLVLLSNVLLYYRQETQRRMLHKVLGCLAPGGYLIAGESERQIVASSSGTRPVAPPAAVFQKISGNYPGCRL